MFIAFQDYPMLINTNDIKLIRKHAAVDNNKVSGGVIIFTLFNDEEKTEEFFDDLAGFESRWNELVNLLCSK